MNWLKRTFQEIRQYPSALVGLGIITGLILVSIYTIIAIPYSEAVYLWRGGEDVWYNSPKTASPKWVNWFRQEKLPETFSLDTRDGEIEKNYETSGDLADLLTTMHFYGLKDSYINDFEKNVDDMTVEKANEIITKYFPKENLQFVLIGKADEIRDKVKKYGEVTEKNIEDDGF